MQDENELEFQKMVEDAFPERMVTNWIIIAESVTGDSKDLHVATSDEITTWLASGMIHLAEEIILNQGFGHDDGEEEDGES